MRFLAALLALGGAALLTLATLKAGGVISWTRPWLFDAGLAAVAVSLFARFLAAD
jgi:hypothetical protein